MGGAALYLWLALLCVLSVLVLFALGWGLSRVNRKREPKGRVTKMEREEREP